MGHFRPLFPYLCLIYCKYFHYKILPMTGYELWTCVIGSIVLPTEPLPLPIFSNIVGWLKWNLLWLPNFLQKMGHFRPLFSLFSSYNTVDFVFSIQLIVHISFANEWIWTVNLWSRNRLLYQLRHNHFPWSVNVSSWLDSNCRSLVSEVTTLPTEPQPLLKYCLSSVLSQKQSKLVVSVKLFFPYKMTT